MREVNWRDASSLRNINAWEAFEILSQIGAHFKRPTTDAGTQDEFANIDASSEAVEFCSAANRLGSRLRARGDCRPQLRIDADERRQTKLTPDEEAAEFAANARAYHRR